MPEQFSELAHEAAACDSTRTGPKMYLVPLQGDMQYGLIVECNAVIMSGLMQAQPGNLSGTSMSMTMDLFVGLEMTPSGSIDRDSQGQEVSL